MARTLAFARDCLDAARNGRLARPSTPAEQACVSLGRDPNKLDATLAAAARRRLTEPKGWEAVVSELAAVTPEGDHIDTNSAELDATAFDFGDRPLVVLSRGVAETAPGVAPASNAAVEAAWIAGHAALAARSKAGEHLVVAGARHYVQIDRPKAVVDAVTKVVKALQATADGAARP
jgi:hypothetical protein